MSKDIIVLTPNGRRHTVRCTADTSILHILEEACRKQGIQPSDYDLKHHNHILDLTSTIRFANLPNKATVELVEADKKRQESTVTIGLLLEDGDRRTADFLTNTALYDLVISLAPSELQSIQNPSIIYMRQEVTGLPALRLKTLRQLGLIKGRAILRLLDKPEEAKQANVSSVYRKVAENTESTSEKTAGSKKFGTGATGNLFDPIAAIKQNINNSKFEDNPEPDADNVYDTKLSHSEDINEKWRKIEEETEKRKMANLKIEEASDSISLPNYDLERRLNIDNEVTFLGEQKALAFLQPDETEHIIEDLPDDFYELSVEEVRKMYVDLQQNRMMLENAPLLTSTKKEELQQQSSNDMLNTYKNVVVRIQFPDNMILQGIFTPTNTIQDINNFIKHYLKTPDKSFSIFTTPMVENLDPQTTLMKAKFVPCVRMHFRWVGEGNAACLRDDIYSKLTSSEAASLLASKYRAPCRRKINDSDNLQSSNEPSTSKNKVPKWFK